MPGCAHVLLSPLPGIPETACGADPRDPAAAMLRCGAEAVERITAWTGSTAPGTGTPHAGLLGTDLFAQDDCQPVPCGQDTLVRELHARGSAGGLFRVDRAAVRLGTTGWFPAGSTGYAAAPTRAAAIDAAAWEVLERDLLTSWWRGTEPAVRQETGPQDRDEPGTGGIGLIAIRIGVHCTAVAAFDPVCQLAATGSSAGPDPRRRTAKATQEALITLAQLRDLLPGPGDAARATLDNPADPARGLENTLHDLLDPRFAAAIRSRFAAVPGEPGAAVAAGDDPVRALRERGHRTFAAELRSPESHWSGLTVMRVLAAGASTPLPRCARPAELPVPLA